MKRRVFPFFLPPVQRRALLFFFSRRTRSPYVHGLLLVSPPRHAFLLPIYPLTDTEVFFSSPLVGSLPSKFDRSPPLLTAKTGPSFFPLLLHVVVVFFFLLVLIGR